MLFEENRIKFGAKGETRPQLKVYLSVAQKLGIGKASTTVWENISPDSIIWSETGTATNGTKEEAY